jgi:hypothetical protein
LAPGILTALTVCGLQRRDVGWAGVGLKGLGDARWLDNVEAIEEPDSPPQTHKPCHRQRAGTQKKTHTWLPFEIALLVLAPAESLIELATELFQSTSRSSGLRLKA